MITIESGAMQWIPLRVRWIIGAVLAAALLGGCTMLRLGYSQGPTLLMWWIDGYADLNDAQTVRLREGVDAWFEWHRRTQLADYATLLARAQREVMEPATPQSLCAWRDLAQQRLEIALDRAVPAVAELAASLSAEQRQHMERKLAKDGAELRDDFAQPDLAERAEASLKRTQERFESLYGRLDDAQRARLAQLLETSMFDPARWLAERDRRNADMMRTLAAAAAPGDASQAQAAVRLIFERLVRSARPEYRAYQERLSLENCALAATMHNLMTPAQRQHARRKLRGWEEDLRLMATPSPG